MNYIEYTKIIKTDKPRGTIFKLIIRDKETKSKSSEIWEYTDSKNEYDNFTYYHAYYYNKIAKDLNSNELENEIDGKIKTYKDLAKYGINEKDTVCIIKFRLSDDFEIVS